MITDTFDIKVDMSHHLADRLGIGEVKHWAKRALSEPPIREAVLSCSYSPDKRVSMNALWIMTHFCNQATDWIFSIRNDLIDRLLTECDGSKKRLFLQLLRDLNYQPDDVRPDFLDFCLSKINSECEPYAVRCFSLYAAFNMCRHYPELIAELEQYLEWLGSQSLSPGLKCAKEKVGKKIAKLKP